MFETEEKSLKELHWLIVESIARRSGLKTHEVESLDIEEMEDRMKIRAKPPRTYFQWEEGEKLGWQTHPYRFVSTDALEKREKKLQSVLSRVS